MRQGNCSVVAADEFPTILETGVECVHLRTREFQKPIFKIIVLINTSLLKTVQPLQMPVLLIWGIEHQVFPKEQAQNAVSRLKQGQLALIPDC